MHLLGLRPVRGLVDSLPPPLLNRAPQDTADMISCRAGEAVWGRKGVIQPTSKQDTKMSRFEGTWLVTFLRPPLSMCCGEGGGEKLTKNQYSLIIYL